jgi:hypothetical protein
MNRNTFRVLATALSVVSAVACGGTTADFVPTDEMGSTISALEAGATVQRAYVGVTNQLTIGQVPVVAVFDLLGGAQLDIEVATLDSSPVRFELWRVRVDGTATLESPVDARSGFALQRMTADENGTWLLRFPAAAQATALVHMDCLGGIRGCTPERQPGETCPAGWDCDTGLDCELPVGACSPLAALGTCALVPTSCPEDIQRMCGCDGKTYASECAALMAGQPIAYGGPCK